MRFHEEVLVGEGSKGASVYPESIHKVCNIFCAASLVALLSLLGKQHSFSASLLLHLMPLAITTPKHAM